MCKGTEVSDRCVDMLKEVHYVCGKECRTREMGAEAEALGFGQVTPRLRSQVKDIGLLKVTNCPSKSSKQESTGLGLWFGKIMLSAMRTKDWETARPEAGRLFRGDDAIV